MQTCDLLPADLDDLLDLVVRAFGGVTAEHTARRRRTAEARIADGRSIGVRDGGRLIAAAAIIDMAQYWHGRAVPLAGVSSVVVAPEDRGRGAGPLLMKAVLERSAARGRPLSMLFPATSAVYRKVGYETAGPLTSYIFPAAPLRALAPRGGPQVRLRRVGAADAAEVIGVLSRVHAAGGHCGPTVRRAEEVQWWLAADDVFTYLADDGLLAYSWADANNAIAVEYLAAGSEATMRALWGVVASNGSIVDWVYAPLAPDDPVFWLTRDPVAMPRDVERWMLRVVDVPSAIAARGFPPGARAETVLTVADPTLPGNAGTWRLTVADGTGRADPAPSEPGATRLDIRGLAALYAGTPAETLRLTGLLTAGDPATDAALGAAFACRAFTLDSF
ncbi:MAG TPA: GNAT family N-acetyltransferase [Streptosporangiaceae bacterium]